MASAGDYAWVDDSTLGEAACVTAVVGLDREAVLSAFGADTTSAVDFEDAYGFDSDDESGADVTYVAVREITGGVVAVERNGFQGSLAGILGPLSARGVAASMFWNVEEDNAFSCARDGEILASVDMYDAEDADDIELPEELRALFETATADDADLHAIGLAMVEAFTGIKVTPEDIAELQEAHPVRSA